MSSRAASFVALAVYEAVVGVWLYAAVRHPAAGAGHIVLPLAAAAGSVVLGYLLRTWWALAAAALLPVLALPGGDYRDTETPLWLVAPLLALALAFWIAVGVGARRLRR